MNDTENYDNRGRRHNHRSTQDFENQNGMRYNRGREGDQEWRMQDYDQQQYRNDYGPNVNYGEHYGQGAYGRAQYRPQREDFPNREQDYRGGEWNQRTRSYEGRNEDRGEGRYDGRFEGREEGRSSENRGEGRQQYSRGIPSGMEQFGGDIGRQQPNRQREDSGYAEHQQFNGSSNWSNSGTGAYSAGEQSGRYQYNQGSNVPMSGYGTMAQYGRGPHAGKGPKNYKRSDERIQEEICEQLTRHDGIDASGIEVTVRNGEVTLSGTVPDRRTKRMAEDAIDSIAGVRDVQVQLRVSDAQRQSTNATSSNGTTSNNSSSQNGGQQNGQDNRGDIKRSKTMVS